VSQFTITTTIVMAGLLAGVLLWQVLEIGKEQARGKEGAEITGRVDRLEGRVEDLEARSRDR